KPIIEKLPVSGNHSFLACTYRTPNFEVPWHQHIEFELLLFTEGDGVAFVGNYVGEFTTGDIFFLGSNLPHTFQKDNKEMMTSAVVVQFREDFWGEGFLALPESARIRELFEVAAGGLKLNEKLRRRLFPLMQDMEMQSGFKRVIRLCECLEMIATASDYEIVSTQEVKAYNAKHKERLDAVFQYSLDNFQNGITLEQIASCAGMSVPAFCSYFKKSTKKTYIDFLNEIRIGYACKALIDTRQNIESICYESGFNTLANFNRQFARLKRQTPSAYRKRFVKQDER
ncbi:MAG: helix-turn-helix transcriptional regulator, partial [Gemmatimonadaceae bacterium]|nr:helix-turn-helix transcriptional regulator [Chitinophagaceae bacterium]